MNERLYAYASAIKSEVKSVIEDQKSILFELLSYHFGWTNPETIEEGPTPIPHFESLLCMHLSRIQGNDDNDTLQLAVALELITNFIEIHNDVQNGGQGAHSNSIWWSWGPAQAINAGDGLHALARPAILNHPNLKNDHILLAIKNLDRSCLSLFEGQFTDINFRDQMEIEESSFIDMLQKKSGSMPSCSSFLSTIPAERLTSQHRDLYAEIGRDLGVALQISRDIIQIWGPEDTGITRDNLMLRRKTLPLIYTLNHSEETTKRKILTAYMSRVMDDEAGETLVNIMTECGAKEYAQSKAQSLYLSSINKLKELNGNITDTDLNVLSSLYEDFSK